MSFSTSTITDTPSLITFNSAVSTKLPPVAASYNLIVTCFVVRVAVVVYPLLVSCWRTALTEPLSNCSVTQPNGDTVFSAVVFWPFIVAWTIVPSLLTRIGVALIILNIAESLSFVNVWLPFNPLTTTPLVVFASILYVILAVLLLVKLLWSAIVAYFWLAVGPGIVLGVILVPETLAIFHSPVLSGVDVPIYCNSVVFSNK